MVRNGVVKHPLKWECCGYHEIQSPRQRYGTIDHTTLKKIFQLTDCNELAQAHRKWVEEALKTTRSIRETQWTESIAVGNQPFLQEIHDKLKLGERGKQIIDGGTGHQLRERQAPYGTCATEKTHAPLNSNQFPWKHAILPGSHS